jgi:transposase
MSEAQAARTFSVSLSSVNVALRREGSSRRIPDPKEEEARGSAPRLDEKARKLLEQDLKERPFATLRERCDYVDAMTGISVSRSTMCRAIARIGPTRKKGGG